MKIEVFGKNYNPSDSLKSVIEKKSAKIGRRVKKDEDAVLKYTVTLENDVYKTDAVLVSKGITYRAEAESDSPFDNVDVVIPRLLGQIRKQKDIWGRDKKGAEKNFGGEEK